MDRLTLIAVWLAIGCGGKAQDSPEKTEPELCTELQSSADESLQALVAQNNTCTVDADCTSVPSIGGCFTYCILPINGASVETVTRAERVFCRSYAEQGCENGFACPNSPGVACSGGRCVFRF